MYGSTNLQQHPLHHRHLNLSQYLYCRKPLQKTPSEIDYIERQGIKKRKLWLSLYPC